MQSAADKLLRVASVLPTPFAWTFAGFASFRTLASTLVFRSPLKKKGWAGGKQSVKLGRPNHPAPFVMPCRLLQVMGSTGIMKSTLGELIARRKIRSWMRIEFDMTQLVTGNFRHARQDKHIGPHHT
jgi:hypothetical protein